MMFLLSGAAADAGGRIDIIELVKIADPIVQGVMLLLVLASIWSWAIIIDRWLTLRGLESKARKFEDEFWSGKSLEDLSRLADLPKNPFSQVFGAALREWRDSRSGARRSGWEGTSSRIDRVMGLIIARELNKAESGLGILASIGSASPFIGLFGTVWGIMNTFIGIYGEGTTQLAVVAPGIAEALLATGLGLVAAIPAVIFYNGLSSRVARYATRLEGYADELSAVFSRRLESEG